jgi:transcriptional regulator with XRE-family HTH domain
MTPFVPCHRSWLYFPVFSSGSNSHPLEDQVLIIGDRLRALREEREFSQGEVEKRTGLLRCYISRVENGHTVPAVETLEKFARALEVPPYQLFYDGSDKPPVALTLPKQNDKTMFGSSAKQARQLAKFRRHLSNINEQDLKLLLALAAKMAKASPPR